MATTSNILKMALLTAICARLSLLAPSIADAHCDTLDGPVVSDARIALEKGDITPVLKWVKEEYEPEVRAAFQKALVVRTRGSEAKDLADTYFFETLIRLHRAGEGAPYTGLKPAGTDLGPAVAGADKALESGSVGNLAKLVAGEVASGIYVRFEHALEARKHADESVEAGREFVEAYVEFVHYVERLYFDAESSAAHHAEEKAAEAQQEHDH